MARLVAPGNSAGHEPGAPSGNPASHRDRRRPRPSHAGGSIVCDISAVNGADLATVDSIARLCLGARRAHRPMVVLGASPELRDLIGFVGLAGVFYPRRRAAAKPSGVELER